VLRGAHLVVPTAVDDREFVDKWCANYDNANRATAYRLSGTRLDAELRKERQNADLRERFAAMYDRLRQFSTRYEFEDFLFTSVHADLRRGYYAAEEFLVVGNRKSRRPIGFYIRNTAVDIRDTTRIAFTDAGRPWRQPGKANKPWNVLDRLHGVGIPVASALLTVWQPDTFTVIDFRALHTPGAHGEIPLDPRAMPSPERTRTGGSSTTTCTFAAARPSQRGFAGRSAP
jgi:hypothetical protein